MEAVVVRQTKHLPPKVTRVTSEMECEVVLKIVARFVFGGLVKICHI